MERKAKEESLRKRERGRGGERDRRREGEREKGGQRTSPPRLQLCDHRFPSPSLSHSSSPATPTFTEESIIQ